MLRLDDLTLFARSAALGSFSNAAREVDLLPGQVSAAIGRLERELGVRLFARSTRSLRLTAEGERYLPYAREVLATLAEGREQLQGEAGGLHGTLQLALPSDLGRNRVLDWLGEFRREHPRLGLRLYLSDQIADVFRDPVDVAVRYGQLEDASYVALPLADNRRVLVAAPDYLARNGHPQRPEDLTAHTCLCYLMHGRVYDKWVFHEGDKRRQVTVRGLLVSDDADLVRRWAVAGEGVAYKSWLDVQADVEAGRLELLLPGFQGERTPLQLVCPHRKQFSPAVQALYAFLRQRFSALAPCP
ncbi:LysR family transcriptional regulator [Pseudomonas citronellolis]|uniref:LysR family transcriptional regulator n=1 Tax=Pseudomonas citronellolis TaxID=53408 RepID=UPI0023E44B3B|nr:LysR family transcriptional regulator [Pseudomonas citronellolis]MDF3933921.1 LysR family transcriptional regulator [Pseudomonas citronellolis]